MPTSICRFVWLFVACVCALCASSGLGLSTSTVDFNATSEWRVRRSDDFAPPRSVRNGLRAGYYTIQSLAESCGTSYLSSSKSGGRVRLQSATAKAPRQWLLRPKAGTREYTLTPQTSGASGGSTRLSYSKDCWSSSVNLSPKNMLSWTVRYSYSPGGKSTYSIVASGKVSESKRNKQCPVFLGCIRAGAKGSVATPRLLSETSRATAWNLRFVGPVRTPSSPPSPPPPPPPLVKIEVVFITFLISNETTESFGQVKQDALCAAIVAASGDPRARCQVTSVSAEGNGRRRMMQTVDTINVGTWTVFTNPGDPNPANSLVNYLTSPDGDSGGSSGFGENVQVESVSTASAEVPDGTPLEGFEFPGAEPVPLPAPPASPVPSPIPNTTPNPTPNPTPIPTPLPPVVLNKPTVAASPGTVKNQVSVTGTAPPSENSGTTLKITCTTQGSGCPASGAAGWVVVTTSGVAQQVATLSDGTTGLTKGTTYTCWSAEFHSTTYACSDPVDMIAYPYTVKCPTTPNLGTIEVGGVTYTKRNENQLRHLVCNADYPSLSTSCITGVTSLSSLFNYKTTFNEDIGTWDTSGVTTMTYTFEGASDFDRDISKWDTSAVLIMNQMFDYATAFNQDIGGWNTGAVMNMDGMFNRASSFNQDISGWNTGAVTIMSAMFSGATSFNNGGQPLAWSDTSKVESMASMFNGATAFNHDISGWNTGAVTNMIAMFAGATSFNNGGRPLAWSDTSKVGSMASMFNGATAFNQDVSGWNTGAVTNMNQMFSGATSFNNGGQPLAWSDTSKVESMASMFKNAVEFNSVIVGWNTGAVTTMQGMFNGATAFNQDISGWNTDLVTNMQDMFNGATAFNQDLNDCSWDVAGVTSCSGFSSGSGFSDPCREPDFTNCVTGGATCDK